MTIRGNDDGSGDDLPRSRIVRQQDIDAYAEVSGDRNPIHVDPNFARGTEFGRTIAHGQLLLGYLASAVVDELGVDWEERGGLEVKFVRPVYVDDRIDVVVEDGRPGEVRAEVRVGDRTAVVASASVGGEDAGDGGES